MPKPMSAAAEPRMSAAELKRIGARYGRDGRLRREFAFGKHSADEFMQRLTKGDTTAARPGTADKGLYEADLEDFESGGETPFQKLFGTRKSKKK